MRNLTKKDRESSRTAQFSALTSNGWSRETYKGLDIFTKDQAPEVGRSGVYSIQVFQGSAANAIINEWHRSAASRDHKTESVKAGFDRREAFKAEQKEKYKGLKSSHAAAAAALREELKNAFPGVKFSVTSESFSMGDAVRVGWTDGPTTAQVEEFSGKYQYGHFDGMTDMYESSNRRDDIPQAKYVTESRHISDEVRAIVQAAVNDKYSHESFRDIDRDRLFNDIIRRSALPVGCTVTGLVECGNDYVIGYTMPEASTRPAPAEVPAGKIQVIDYSEKAIAVIGDTKSIKEVLKNLGGRFNFRLSCGAGWIFPKTKQAQVIEALKRLKEAPIMERLEAAAPEKAEELRGEWDKMQEFISEPEQLPALPESVTFAEEVQDIEPEHRQQIPDNFVLSVPTIKQEEPRDFDSLQDLEEAANGGEVVSLYNLSNLLSERAKSNRVNGAGHVRG